MAGEKTGRLWEVYTSKTAITIADELQHIKTFTPPQATRNKIAVSSLKDGEIIRNIKGDLDAGTITITGDFRTDSTAYADLKTLETEDIFKLGACHPSFPDVGLQWDVMIDTLVQNEVTREGVLSWTCTLSILSAAIPFVKPIA
jgi:hypothetical protein